MSMNGSDSVLRWYQMSGVFVKQFSLVGRYVYAIDVQRLEMRAIEIRARFYFVRKRWNKFHACFARKTNGQFEGETSNMKWYPYGHDFGNADMGGVTIINGSVFSRSIPTAFAKVDTA